MPQAKFSVTLPEETWIRNLTEEHPDATFKVVTTLVSEEKGVALVELLASDPAEVVSTIDRFEEVSDVDLLWERDDEGLLQITTPDPVLLAPVRDVGVPLSTPFEIRDGETTWETTTTSTRLSAFGDRLSELDFEFDVEYVRRIDDGEADRLLTDRQLEVLTAAAEQGYYASPRTATLTEVADSLDISKATASNILQRAEGKIIDWFIDEYAPVT